MKLTKIVVALVAIIGGVTAGGSWYTGKQIEQQYPEMIEQGNQQLKVLASYGIEAKIQAVEFERHLFSSKLNYDLVGDYQGKPFLIKGESDIFHGPFPYNRLTQGNLLPAMLSSESQLNAVDHQKNKGKRLLSAQIAVGYNRALDGRGTLDPFKIDDDQNGIESSAVDLKFRSSNGKSLEYLKIKFDRLQLSTQQENEVIHIIADNGQYEFQIAEPNAKYPYLNPYQNQFTADNLTLYPTGDESISNPHKLNIEKVDWQSFTALNKERFRINGAIKTGDWKIKNALHSASIFKTDQQMELETDAAIFNEIAKTVAEKSASGHSVTAEQIYPLLLSAIEYEPSAKIKTVYENEQGKNEITLDLNLAKVKQDQLNFNNVNQLLSLLKPSQLTISFSPSSLQLFIDSLARLTPNNLPDNVNQYKQQINHLVEKAKSSGLAVSEGDQVKTTLAVENGKLVLNNQEVSVQMLQMILFSFFMGIH